MTDFIQTVGSSRRSQLISTFGIGAIIDFSDGSYMPLGLDFQDKQWTELPLDVSQSISIYEPRLQRLLNVSMFRSLPVPGDKDKLEFGKKVKKAFTIPVTRFPNWLECPVCHRLGKVGDPFEETPDYKVKCIKCKANVNPVRFVVACRRGHIQDFPWEFWCHIKKDATCGNPKLFLKSHGKSQSLDDLYVECTNSECRAKQSLGDIFSSPIINNIDCRGQRPWLLDREPCDQKIETIQRGASNIHFGVHASMLSIPPASDAISRILEPFWSFASALGPEFRENGLATYLKNCNINIDIELLRAWIRKREQIDSGEDVNDEQSARYEEYLALCTDHYSEDAAGQASDFENKAVDIPDTLKQWFDLASAVQRLREVRAYCGFTRILPVSVPVERINSEIIKNNIAPVANSKKSWLPATEVRGEGIFLRFSESRIKSWIENDKAVVQRTSVLNSIFTKVWSDREMEAPYKITPRLLLIHSLSHALIRRFSLECGYSSASLRERLYISDGDENSLAMAGLLIYTASADSDGSLGGLVNMAKPERLEETICGAINDIEWCANDPVCLENDPLQSGERLTGACCHSCLLVPETACEKFNRELDRAMLTGNGNNIAGYFKISERGL